MRRCSYCYRVYTTNFQNCPLCGKHMQDWEPVEEKADKETVTQLVKRILRYMINMGD